VEALANVAVGFATALLSTVFPLFSIETTIAEDGVIAILFTIVSLLHSWCLRRLFVAIERRHSVQEEDRIARLERRMATGRVHAKTNFSSL
jgi:membrane protein implicated in regulation of membrane protease activity